VTRKPQKKQMRKVVTKRPRTLVVATTVTKRPKKAPKTLMVATRAKKLKKLKKKLRPLLRVPPRAAESSRRCPVAAAQVPRTLHLQESRRLSLLASPPRRIA
jgi:hypothetical protein